MLYFIKTPRWLQKLYSNYIWHMPEFEKIIYLTFDDGPHKAATSFVLDTLKAYQARATFFCIGKNVLEFPDLYSRIIFEGHAVGNHTFDHLNGWKTNDEVYMNNIAYAKKYIDSTLFRPPYGRISKFQLQLLSTENYKMRAIMWTVLSGDFDEKVSNESCFLNVVNNADNGSIIVFHDSEKAYQKIVYALPRVLQYFTEKGFRFEKITYQ